jgi:hypothetical protein
MFVETIELPRAEWERWHEALRYTTDPPEAMVATIVWESGDGRVTGINLWDTPDSIADFFVDRVGPIIAADGEPSEKPQRRGEPLAVYIRQ